MTPQTFLSPAKINLNLEIKGKRADGYHELESLMAKISLYDELIFSKADNYQLSFTDNEFAISDNDCSFEDNLITKAAKLWEQTTGQNINYHIHVTKNIPHGAGLGGGSSNAVTTLQALNQLHEQPLTHQQLIELANQLGSDMACFMQTGIVQCRGRGEIITPYSLDSNQQLEQENILLIKPQFSVHSAEAYQLYQKYVTDKGLNHKQKHHSSIFDDLPLFNDLEVPVFIKYPFLVILKDWLNQQPEIELALMTGSGSTMIAYLKDPQQGTNILERARQHIDPTLWGTTVKIIE